MKQDSVDLSQLFGAALTQLAANRDALNTSDTANHDHGDNMVQAFEIMTKTVAGHKGDPASTALAAASKALARKTTSGSGQIYANGLAQAATALQGQHLTADNAISLINLVLGGGAADSSTAPPGPMGMDSSTPAVQEGDGGIDVGDLLSAGAQILAGAGGRAQSGASQPSQPDGGIDMGDLLSAGAQILAGSRGGAQGGASPSPSQEGAAMGGMDMGQMFNMWMAYRQAKQRGGSDFDAILNAVLSRSQTAQSAPYRQQSTEIVANALLQAVLGQR